MRVEVHADSETGLDCSFRAGFWGDDEGGAEPAGGGGEGPCFVCVVEVGFAVVG